MGTGRGARHRLGRRRGLHIFCAVMAFSRWRFVRFAADEKASTTFEMLARCFEALGAVPKVVLADRMGCLKGGVVANIVVPTPAYVRFALHYGFRPDFCEVTTPSPKGSSKTWSGMPNRTWSSPRSWSGPTCSGPTRRPGLVRRGERAPPLRDLCRAGRAAGG